MEKLGVVETEQFISVIMRENFDYTKWQRERFDDLSSEEFHKEAIEYARKNPFKKKE